MVRKMICVSGVLVSMVLGGCSEESTPAAKEPATVTLPASLVLTSAPEGAKAVKEVRAAKAGEKIVVRGVVGGRADPVADNRAVFTLLDESIPTCDKNPADECKTPWDACCEPADEIAASSASVQVVDADGRPLKVTLAGAGGLKPLSRVTVVGTAVPSPDGKALAINATGLHVQQ